MMKRGLWLVGIILGCWASVCLAEPGPSGPRVRFSDVVSRARDLAGEPFVPSEMDLPPALKAFGYDEWRDLRFVPEQSLWAGDVFSLQFFHPGFLYQAPVSVYAVERGRETRVPFAPDLFSYAQSAYQGESAGDLDFAGFRVHYPINTRSYADEVIAFLGASYFRALAKDLVYGISARGLAVDTAEMTGEEFPHFRAFWIVRPGARAKTIAFYALMDSRSLTGAYEFRVRPGEETVVDVNAVLFFRKGVRKLGLAPLTSMFFYGENRSLVPGADFRPEVHDSDGLLIETRAGEWIWHPLINPKRLLINSFGGGCPRGFGLIQRDMDFGHYLDLEARYDRRPSVWIEPKGDWGAGWVELLQIPVENEYNDNIGAYWVVDAAFEEGAVFEYAYTMRWYAGSRRRSALATAESTRIETNPRRVRFFVDFLLDPSQSALLDRAVEADVEVFNDYRIFSAQVIPNTVQAGWRLVLEVDLESPGILNRVIPGKPAVEVRALLKAGGTPVTETWSYTFLPQDHM